MSGLQCEEVMAWTLDDVLKWIQMNNLGNFHAFIARECITGQQLLQLDKKRLENAIEAKKSDKENLLKLLKGIGKEKDNHKKKIKLPTISWKGVKGALPTNVQPPSIKPPKVPDFEEIEDGYGSDEWDDDRGIYDNDTQPVKLAVNLKVQLPTNADNESENESEYVNPDEEFQHENNESHNVQDSIYEEDTTSTLKASGGRGAAPLPPLHHDDDDDDDDDELYEDPDQNVTVPPLPPIPSGPSKARNARLPPPIPSSDDFYDTADPPPMKAPPAKHSNYEPAAIARMPSASKSRGAVPPAPALVPQEEFPEKAPERPPQRTNRRPVPPPCIPVPDDDHDDPAPVRPAHVPPVAKRAVPVPSIPAPAPQLLHHSPPQEIYEEAEDLPEKILPPPGRRGSQGGGRPAVPKPPPQNDDIYEPPPDEALESPPSPPMKPANRRAPAPLPVESNIGGEIYEPTEIPDPERDDEDVPVWSDSTAPQPMTKVPGNFGVSSIALRDIKGNLKRAVPNFNPGSSSTNNATNEVKGKFQETTQRAQPRPPDAPKKMIPPAPPKQRSGGAPGGPDSAEPPRERALPGAPPVKETASHSSTASHFRVADPNDVTAQPWFFGDLSSKEAADLLKKLNRDGTYLVRESKRSGHLHTLVLSFKDDIFNIPIRKRLDGTFALGTEKAAEHVFETVDDMIRFHRNNTIEVSKEGKAVGKVKLAKIAEK